MAYVIHSVVYEYVCNIGAELYLTNYFWAQVVLL